MTAIKLASRMRLKAGCLDEYRRRHDALWPDLAALLRDVGIRDYSIHHDPADGALFAVMWCDTPERLAELPDHPVMRRWWAAMASLMAVNADLSPQALPLDTVFHLI
jgi:L-rhamnose mutarotase